jgi:apolipoprotein N-acyltransferase
MSKRNLLLLSVLTGVLLSPAWYSTGAGPLLLIAMLPLLIAENEIQKNPARYRLKQSFSIAFLGFAVFNLLTTWWIKNASFAGLIVAILLNSLLMSTVFYLFSLTRRRLGDIIGYSSLIFYWIAYEYMYLNAEISWTWMNLGNGFAHNIQLIQWYEVTGVLGGTFWILLTNILAFRIYDAYRNGRKFRNESLAFIAAVIIPIAISLTRFYTYREKTDPYNVVVLQPNIDPYQKFNDIPADEQMKILLELASGPTDSTTDYIVAPETFINNNLWLDDMEYNPSIRSVRSFIAQFPKAKMIVGATTYKFYPTAEEKSETSRPFRGGFYDSFNSSLQIDSSRQIQYYHKSQLVVGVEKMPYTRYLKFLEKIMLNLGGTFRSHGIQKERTCLYSPQDSLCIATPICYESIFGEYVSDYLVPGKESLIFVITNDGWWGDTPGYVQHNSFSSIRAIENRRSIARSANTGISSFINQKGEVLQKIGWWQRSAIKATLNANDTMTFYTLHGDFLGRISVWLGIAGLAGIALSIIFHRRKSQV